MLVSPCDALDGVNVHAALVGKGGRADKGLAGHEVHVGKLIDVAAQLGEPAGGVGQQAVVVGLEQQVGGDGDQIDVATALADAVDRALNVADAGVDGGQ